MCVCVCDLQITSFPPLPTKKIISLNVGWEGNIYISGLTHFYIVQDTDGQVIRTYSYEEMGTSHIQCMYPMTDVNFVLAKIGDRHEILRYNLYGPDRQVVLYDISVH